MRDQKEDFDEGRDSEGFERKRKGIGNGRERILKICCGIYCATPLSATPQIKVSCWPMLLKC